jgi:sensor histidine kinase YesM
VQPLVENSIAHAFNPRSAPGRLEIIVALDGPAGTLNVTVRDDGPGCTPEALAAGRGLGLKTVARRLQLEHGARASLRTETAPGAGFTARLVLPLTA